MPLTAPDSFCRDLFKLVISFVLGSFKWTAEMKSHLPLNLVSQYIKSLLFTVNL